MFTYINNKQQTEHLAGTYTLVIRFWSAAVPSALRWIIFCILVRDKVSWWPRSYSFSPRFCLKPSMQPDKKKSKKKDLQPFDPVAGSILQNESHQKGYPKLSFRLHFFSPPVATNYFKANEKKGGCFFFFFNLSIKKNPSFSEEWDFFQALPKDLKWGKETMRTTN